MGPEIARGGMGAVYRATDTVLKRPVAVKVIQAKYGPDTGATRRFAEEARITAQLQHPAIPPVHDLGSLPDGRPFLAMKLVKGDTLHDLLARRKESGEVRGRLVAVFEKVCEALAYAHAHDVVHRDLKPANVMVGAFGEVQVMDWGLAKVLGERSGAIGPSSDPAGTTPATEVGSAREEGSETQAGSVLGTPAFMPPEQAIGAIDQIDSRSDVFGLGGILASILTGDPPFVAATGEQTRQMAAKGRVEPCFARLDASGADPELIALCKRCLAHEKDDRPANGGEVAKAVAALRAAADERARQADLDRVKAEGETAAAEVRAAEQAKRRRTMLWAGGVVAAVLLAGTAVSLWQASEARAAKKVADEKAEAATRAEAATAAQLLKTQQAEAGTAAQLVISRERTKSLSDAYGDFVFGIQNKLGSQPGTQVLRRSLLETARTGLKKILDDARAQGSPDQTLVWSHFRMGDVEMDLGNTLAAQKEYQAGHELAKSLADANPKLTQFQRDLGISFNNLGKVTQQRGQPKAALDFFQKGLDVSQRLADADPKNAQAQRDLGVSLGYLGSASLQLGQMKAARDYYLKYRDVNQKLADADPTSLQAQRSLGFSFTKLGDVSLQLGDAKAAHDFYRTALDVSQKLADADPDNAQAQRNLGIDLERYGITSLTLGQATVALDAQLKVVGVRQKLADADPANVQAQRNLGISFERLGNLRVQLGDAKAALDAYQKAHGICQKLADADPANAQARGEAFVCCYRVGRGWMAIQEYSTAVVWFGKADQSLTECQTKGWFVKPDERLANWSIGEWRTEVEQKLKWCRKVETALADLEFALRQPEAEVPWLLDSRVQAFVKKNDRKNLLSTATAYEKLATADDRYRYNGACAWSQASRLTNDDAKAREEYASKAVGLLRKTPTGKGYFADTPAKLAAHVKQDTDLDPLRDRADFKAFVASLETATSQPPSELAPSPRPVKR